MKKLKILPSILMLVLCIGVLAVGVFAITPTTNTISGQITINSSNAPVKIELLKDGTLIRTYDQVRTGITWDVNEFAKTGETNLLFETEGKNQVKEVSKIKFTLRITNLSETEALGAFFQNSEDPLVANAEGVYPLATASNVLGDHTLLDKTDGVSPVADVYISTYTAIGPVTTVSGTKTYDTAEMNIVLSMSDFYTSSKTADLNYKLIIEKYEATENYLTSEEGLIKVPFKSTLTGKAFDANAVTSYSLWEDETWFQNADTTIFLCLPNTITSFTSPCDGGQKFTNLRGISFPNSIRSIGSMIQNSDDWTIKSIDLSGCKNLTIEAYDAPVFNSKLLEFIDFSDSSISFLPSEDMPEILFRSQSVVDVYLTNISEWLNMYHEVYSWRTDDGYGNYGDYIYPLSDYYLYINGELMDEAPADSVLETVPGYFENCLNKCFE